MKITPKNWNTFQHYKDRAPAWIKLHRSLLDDFKFHCLPTASKALAPMLWLLASEYEDGSISASVEEIAFRLRMDVTEITAALNPLIDLGFFHASEPLADCKPAAIPEKEKEKEKEEEDIEKRRGHTSSPTALARSDDWPSDYRFQFWQAYPHKVGKADALKKLDQARKRGVGWEVLMAGLTVYVKTKPIERQWCNPATWLHQERWYDQPAEPIRNERDLQIQQTREIRDALQRFASGETSSGSGGQDNWLLSQTERDRPETIHSGVSGVVIDLPAARAEPRDQSGSRGAYATGVPEPRFALPTFRKMED